MRSPEAEEIESVRRIYESSFPECERADFDKLLRHRERGCSRLLGIYDGPLRGFSYVMYDESIVFILYLAVDERSRGRGLGSSAIDDIRRMFPGRRIFLNIEPPDEGVPEREIRMRRKSFYERNGFEAEGRLLTAECDYIMMCSGGAITGQELASFRKKVGLDALFDGDIELVGLDSISCRACDRSRSGPGIFRLQCRQCRPRTKDGDRIQDSHPL